MQPHYSAKRTPVPLTDSERAEIQTAMKQEGIRTIADFLRIAALKLARGQASGGQAS